MFTYNPLKRENREIRLVRLVPTSGQSAKKDSKICLTIDHVSLDDGTPYMAMSYVWGDVRDTIDIEIDGEVFPVGRNLHALLEQLRADSVGAWIWVDSICIQQSNLGEKSWQVNQMRDVYTLAHSVLLWLGPGSQDSDLAMDFLARVGPKAFASGVMAQWSGSNLRRLNQEAIDYLKARSSGALDVQDASRGSELQKFIFNLLREDQLRVSAGGSALYKGFTDILQRINWHRIWIIQEIALAREALVVCGKKSVSVNAFDATFTAIWCCLLSRPAQVHSDYADFCQGLDSNLYTIKSLDVRRRRQNGEKIRLIDIIFEVLVAPGRPYYSATDPRDIAFGLLGVITDVEKLGISADYTKTVAEVFSMMTRAMIYDKDESQIFKLDCCPPRKEAGSLPSWVPVWQEIGEYGTRFYRVNQRGTFHAAGGMQPMGTPSISEKRDPLLLRRQGLRADVITEVMELPDGICKYEPWNIYRIENISAWLDCIRTFTGMNSEPGPEEDPIWRTVLFDRYDWYPRKTNSGLYPVPETVAQLIRKIMRRENINPDHLIEEQVDFIRNGPFRSDMNLMLKSLKEQVAYLARQWPRALGNMHRERTLFKTAGGRLGVGHGIVKAGDVVTVLWGIGSPIVLRPQAKGWGFLGDAYLDGVMYGELLGTKPQVEDFDIY